MGIARNAARDREIFAVPLKGASMEDFGAQIQLMSIRIDAILRTQRHKVAVRPDPAYHQLCVSRIGCVAAFSLRFGQNIFTRA